MNLKGIAGVHRWVTALALCLAGMGTADANADTSSISSANLGCNSLSFSENGFNPAPMVSTGFTITNGVSTPVDAGSAAITVTPTTTRPLTTGYKAATVRAGAMGSAGLGTLVADVGAAAVLLGTGLMGLFGMRRFSRIR